MKLNQLRDIIAIAEKGSLRAASRHLGLSQSAMTKSIQFLEKELGAPLFERHKRGAVLTPMGVLFLQRARAATNELNRAREEVKQ
jgi:LysR family transcriptional regulator of abg operon